MEYIRVDDAQIAKIYPPIAEEAFGRADRPTPKALIVAGSLEDPVGYIAGHWINDKRFYIQDSGIMPKYRLRGNARHFGRIMKALDGYNISTLTRNDNVASMKILLSTGFIPVGSRVGNEKVFYIEWLKET